MPGFNPWVGKIPRHKKMAPHSSPRGRVETLGGRSLPGPDPARPGGGAGSRAGRNRLSGLRLIAQAPGTSEAGEACGPHPGPPPDPPAWSPAARGTSGN